jgi:hypothetical protein
MERFQKRTIMLIHKVGNIIRVAATHLTDALFTHRRFEASLQNGQTNAQMRTAVVACYACELMCSS